jgi:hypothetical protein
MFWIIDAEIFYDTERSDGGSLVWRWTIDGGETDWVFLGSGTALIQRFVIIGMKILKIKIFKRNAIYFDSWAYFEI